MPYTEHNGLRLHYQVDGRGVPLVLHVGALGRLEDWYRLGYCDALKDEYRLVLIDPLGQGRSDTPHDPRSYGAAERVAHVAAVLDDIGVERAHFFGYSLGGRVGFDLAVQAPRRLRSLVVGGQAPFARDPQQMAARVEIIRREGVEGYLTRAEREVAPLPADVRAQWLANDALAIAAVMAAMGANADLEAALASIELPALIFCGAQDQPHDAAQRAADLMPDATFVSLAGLNHLQALQRTDLLLPHLRAFWQRVAGGTASLTDGQETSVAPH